MLEIKRGAEAVISKGVWHGRDVVFKKRVPKGYRIAELDAPLRRARMRREAQLMVEAREFGVRTPIIFDIDAAEAGITMQFVDGPTAKEVLQSSPERREHARAIGRVAGILHSNDMIHGDLTTSNIIFGVDGIYLIDFGLGEKSAEWEKKGVDLHLLKEAVNSAHSEFPELLDDIFEGYVSAYPEGEKIIEVVHDIEGRGRYS